jgi:hypothetical protein
MQLEKAKEPSFTPDEIDKAIQTGKYVTGPAPGSTIPVNKCNLFTDDMLKQHYGVELPRHSEDPQWAKIYPGWEDRPMLVRSLHKRLGEMSSDPSTGVFLVDPSEAVKRANAGLPVVGTEGHHITLLPKDAKVHKSGVIRPETGKEITQVDAYRNWGAGQGPRGSRTTLSDQFTFYAIDPKVYNEQRKASKEKVKK